jgi:predicted enzyme related to lactoylglutathione lyase
MRSEPMLAVHDVKAAVAWYKQLLGCANDHDLDEYDRLLDGDTVLLTLHAGAAAEHGMRRPAPGAPGGGVLVWVFVPDLQAVFQRAQRLQASVIVAPHVNPRAGWREFTVDDLDGYRIGIIQAD